MAYLLAITPSKTGEPLQTSAAGVGAAPSMAGLSAQWTTFFGTTISPTIFRSALNTWGTTQGFSGTWVGNAQATFTNFATVANLYSVTNPAGNWTGTY